jgi:membrane AbrB-like protein
VGSWLEDVRSGIAALAPGQFPYAQFFPALLLGVLGGWLFLTLRLPLPWMLGAMTACTIAAIAGAPIAAPAIIRPPMSVAIGVMLGASFTPDLLRQIPGWLPALLGLIGFMVASGACVVWYLRRVGGLDPVTAYFAGMPGGLNEMIEVGEDSGGDARTIALAHSARIFLVVMTLPFVIQATTGVSLVRAGGGVSMFAAPLSAEVWLIGCGLAGSLLGHVLGLPAKHLLGAMIVSAAVHASGMSDFKPPYEIINAAQVVLGVVIGCRFAGLPASRVGHMLALSVGATAILLAWTLVWAALVSRLTGMNLITLVLAFSPGGLAEMSLVALALQMEVAFVAAFHLIRIVLIMTTAGAVFRWVETR